MLRSDGQAVACGINGDGQCDVPFLEDGVTYVQVSAGGNRTLMRRSDGQAVACGSNRHGQCDIPLLEDRVTRMRQAAGISHSSLSFSNQ